MKRSNPPHDVIVHAGQTVTLPLGRPIRTVTLPPPPTPAPAPAPAVASKLLTEFFGTVFLTLAFALTTGSEQRAAAMAMTQLCVTYAGAHISGGHFNPAVTLAVLVRGKLTAAEAFAYVGMQLLGGIFAGASAMYLFLGETSGRWWPTSLAEVSLAVPSIEEDTSPAVALVAEAVGAFALCHTMLHVCTSSVQAGNSFFGLATGSALFAATLVIGGVSGGACNPAVASLALVRHMHSATIARGGSGMLQALRASLESGAYIQLSAPLGGGLLAGSLFRLTHVPAQAGGTRDALAPYAIEFVGTGLIAFTFAATHCQRADPDDPGDGCQLAPIALGAAVLSQVYAGGATSGAHYNPAVTVSVSLRRAFAYWEAQLLVPPLVGILYMASQALGALSGGVLATLLFGDRVVPAADVVSPPRVFAAEALATFFVCLVVLQTATVARMASREFFGVAIGLSYAAMAATIGDRSGAVLNPVFALLGELPAMWYYRVAGPFAGGVVAALVFRCVSADSFVVAAHAGSMV